MCVCETDGATEPRETETTQRNSQILPKIMLIMMIKCIIITNNQAVSDPKQTANYSLIWLCTCSTVKPELSLPRISD